MIYSKARPEDAGRSGGLSPRDLQAEPPKQIPADVLRRLKKTLAREGQDDQSPPKTK